MPAKKKETAKKIVKTKVKIQKKPPKSVFLEEFKKKEKETNERQERFCQLYAGDKEFFGNGVETYLEVYDVNRSKPNWYKTACAAASRLLTNVKVYKRINELLEQNGLNDTFVDKQLLFLISQQADFKSKIAAIREYNSIKQRVTKKLEHKITGIKVINYGDKKV